MVIQKAIDNLKGKPKDDKKVVAGGIAIAVVVILFIGWSILFLKKIQSGAEAQRLGGVPDEFNFSSVRDAQEKLMEDFSDIDELRRVRGESGGQVQQGAYQQDNFESAQDEFDGSDT